jgi:hypothetical protein
MTAQYRSRVAAAIGALVAPMALVATTSAPADAGTSSHKHEIYEYKVEKYIRLAGVGTDTVGDSPTQAVSCDPGDIVLDGMWSIKNVDQYNPPPPDPDGPPTTTGGVYNDARDVYVVSSYPDQLDQRRWNFEFDNRAYGDAQVKLFLTCIRSFTEYTNSHRHDVRVRNLTPVQAATTPHATYTDRYYYDHGSVCTADELFVAPGFDLTGLGDHRLVATYPTNAGRGWEWEFGASAPAAPWFYGKCIERRVFDGATPRHSIGMKHMPSANFAAGQAVSVPLGDPKESRYSCDQDDSSLHGYKAMVGWFWMGKWWDDSWFLGMEPRPKTRSYVFWNFHGTPAQVKIGTLCINSRTSFPLP